MENDLFIVWIGSFGVAYSVDSDGKYIWENWDKKLVPTQTEIEAKKIELEKEWQSLKSQRARKRQKEYPSIQELVVALYDADDKAEIDKKRAEIKKKYPKP